MKNLNKKFLAGLVGIILTFAPIKAFSQETDTISKKRKSNYMGMHITNVKATNVNEKFAFGGNLTVDFPLFQNKIKNTYLTTSFHYAERKDAVNLGIDFLVGKSLYERKDFKIKLLAGTGITQYTKKVAQLVDFDAKPQKTKMSFPIEIAIQNSKGRVFSRYDINNKLFYGGFQIGIGNK